MAEKGCNLQTFGLVISGADISQSLRRASTISRSRPLSWPVVLFSGRIPRTISCPWSRTCCRNLSLGSAIILILDWFGGLYGVYGIWVFFILVNLYWIWWILRIRRWVFFVWTFKLDLEVDVLISIWGCWCFKGENNQSWCCWSKAIRGRTKKGARGRTQNRTNLGVFWVHGSWQQCRERGETKQKKFILRTKMKFYPQVQ